MADFHSELTDQKAAARRRLPTDSSATPGADAPVHPVLRLQNQVGNAQVARLLAQRQAEEDEELQTKRDDNETVGLEGGAVGPDTESRIQGMRGVGSPLDSGTQTSMEAAFGTGFDGVRVHTSSDADMLNRRLTSRAFTTGNDIFLRSDASPSDSRLMAHELTHVVQQRSMSGTGGMHVGAAGDDYEQHADAVADSVVSAASAQRLDAPEGALQAQHDVGQRQQTPEDEELQALHDVAQRQEAPEEEEIQALHDVAQRQETPEEEEEIQALHDVQRQAEDEEEPG